MAQARGRIQFIAAVVALGVVVVLAWLFFFARGPADRLDVAPPPAPTPAPSLLTVKSASGTVWVSRGGVRAPLRPGEPLRESDAIETTEGSTLELAAGDRYQILLEGAARFGVKEIAAELSRFRLDDGLASAQVKKDSGSVLVIESSADASVRTAGGRVTVAASDQRVAVGVTDGEAQLGSGGQIVAVRAGQFSMAERGRSPSAPVALPRSLLLKVDWPGGGATNQRRVVIRGRASPGALVSIGGERVKTGPDGTFAHAVVLAEGQQRFEAAARDVAGRRTATASPPVILDTRAPDTEFDTRNLWGKQRP
jgi:hypothetical protein